MHLPFAKFHEDEQSLGGALTYVGIVIEEKYYNAASEMRACTDHEKFVSNKVEKEGWKEWEIDLITELNYYALAH